MAIKNYDELEQQLQQNLNPVRPDPEFVSHLRYRLVNPNRIILENHPQISILLIIVAAGLFSGALLLWLFGRFR